MPIPDTSNYLKDLIVSLASRGIRFVVCGGVAVALHGIERMTLDLDLSLSMAPENIETFIASMKEMGFAPRAPVPATILLDPATIERIVKEKNAIVFTFVHTREPYKQIDVFLTPDASYERLVSDAVAMPLQDVTIFVASRKRLLEMKMAIDPPREKDIMDIRLLGEGIENDDRA
jgi:hypothetical protein